MKPDFTLDCYGLLCPMPVFKASQKIKELETGQILEISEQSFSPRPMPMARAEMAMGRSSDSVPVAVGENTYKVTVKATFAIEQ